MHIAVIPDGNRRFMKKKGILSLKKSYEDGITHFFDFLNWCKELDVNEVTLYALSTENIVRRGKGEIMTLLKVFNKQAISALDDKRIHENRIHVNICGDRQALEHTADNPGLGKKLLRNLKKLEESTKNYSDMTLNMAIGYGGRQEIIHAVKEVERSGLEINEENIQKNLWIKNNPDIIIRTSEERLSNFLLWQSAYSEIYFSNKLWQEFGKEDLERVITEYRERERRFGQ